MHGDGEEGLGGGGGGYGGSTVVCYLVLLMESPELKRKIATGYDGRVCKEVKVWL